MAKTKRKSGAARQAEIIDVALALAAKVGPDRLTTQSLADEIGISQPAIFRHFPSKAAIWRAVAENIAQKMKAEITRVRNPNAPAAKQLQAEVLAQLKFISDTPAVPAILFSRELHAENEALRLYFSNLMASRHQAFSDLIRQEIDAGGFRPNLNPSDGSYLILAFIQGLAMRWSLNARAFDLVAEGEKLLEVQFSAFQNTD